MKHPVGVEITGVPASRDSATTFGNDSESDELIK